MTAAAGWRLSWPLSNTLTAGFCVESLSEGTFTSDEFTKVLRDHGIEISMDGRGRCHDNIFVELFRWTVKHESVACAPRPTASKQPCSSS